MIITNYQRSLKTQFCISMRDKVDLPILITEYQYDAADAIFMKHRLINTN